MKKRKIYVLVYDWVTMYDGSDISIQTFRTKAEARKAMNESYRGTKKDMIDNHSRECVEYEKSKDYACVQLEGRFNECHDRWSIVEQEIEW
jgi:hypothetical protein